MTDMSYTTNPHLPKVRAKAVNLVKIDGWSMRQTARYLGVNPATISKWVKRAPQGRVLEIPTKSSRPRTSPRAINYETVNRIVAIRLQRKRCAQVIHAQLLKEDYQVSLSTVKRVLQRKNLIRSRSKWKKYHLSGQRPQALKPGFLVQTDTIHKMFETSQRVYIYTLIDVFSRWATACAVTKINAVNSVKFIYQARQQTTFNFQCIQSDHGSEFSKYFTLRLAVIDIKHRHTRVRQPNDNAHIERFNRTIQDELKDELRLYRHNPIKLNRSIREYLNYYNNERLHMGIDFKTPAQMLPSS